MNYWAECIAEAFDDAKIQATEEQIATVASWVEGAHENYGLATGKECIPNPLQVEVEALETKCKKLESDVERERMNFKKNVSMRRGCRVEDVEIEEDGHVTIHQ